MALFNNFPWTNFHELNLDWLMRKVADLEASFPEGTIGVNKGGTGANNAEQARENLGISAPNIPLEEGGNYMLDTAIAELENNINSLSDNMKYRIFRTVNSLGLTSGTATIASCWTAMSIGDILIAPPSEFAPGQAPENYGSLILVRSAGTSGSLRFYGSRTYEQPFTNNYPSGTWNQLIDSDDIIPVTNGGTGANNAEDARANLGIDFSGTVLSVCSVGADTAGNIPLKSTDLVNNYESVVDLGLPSGSTITAIWNVLPINSKILCPASQVANTPNNNTNGYIEIYKATSGGYIVFRSNEKSPGDFRMYLDANNAPSGIWKAAAIMRKFTTPSQTLAAGGEGHADVDVSLNGYTPIGIIGIQGNGNSGMYVSDFYIIERTASLWFRNPGTTARTFTYQFAVLYI